MQDTLHSSPLVKFKSKEDDAVKVALSGNGVYLPIENFFSMSDRETHADVLKKYRILYNYYLNEDAGINPENVDEEPLLVNFCKLVVHKTTDWLFGKSFNISPKYEGNIAIAEAVKEIWEISDYKKLCYLWGHCGSITGDGYIVLNWNFDRSGEKLDIDSLRIDWLKSPYVHPVFNPLKSDEMVGCLVQFPINAYKNGDKEEYEIAAPSLDTSNVETVNAIYSKYITTTEVVEFINGFEIGRYTNPFGEIYVVHCQNIISSAGWSGESDIEGIVNIVKNLNKTASSIQSTVNYDSKPTTVITGAEGNDIVFDRDSVVCIKNPDAKVYVLQAGTNIGGSNDHFDRLIDTAHLMSQCPKSTMGILGSMTNTKAGVAELATMPLVEKTRRKYVTYGLAIRQMCGIIARAIYKNDAEYWDRRFVGEHKAKFDRFDIIFPNPLPKDEDAIIDRLIKKVNNYLISREQAVRELQPEAKEEYHRILQDMRMDLVKEIEKAKGLQGQIPNLGVFHLGSLGNQVSDKVFIKEQEEIEDYYKTVKEKSDEQDNEDSTQDIEELRKDLGKSKDTKQDSEQDNKK